MVLVPILNSYVQLPKVALKVMFFAGMDNVLLITKVVKVPQRVRLKLAAFLILLDVNLMAPVVLI
jgi:hypothetical protein